MCSKEHLKLEEANLAVVDCRQQLIWSGCREHGSMYSTYMIRQPKSTVDTKAMSFEPQQMLHLLATAGSNVP